MGHSLGAIEAVILGMHNANMSFVAALDGTYGFEGLSVVLTRSYGYAPEKMFVVRLGMKELGFERAQAADTGRPGVRVTC